MPATNAKMDPATLEALKGSIEKWEEIVAGTGEDQSTANCPLCKMFFENECIGCPVYKTTGAPHCDDTPYQTKWWPLVAYDEDYPKVNSNQRRLNAAQAELDFLKSLLPDGAST